MAEATLQEVLSIQDDLVIRAPAKGMITTRMVDEGEVIAAGRPLFDIVDFDRLYLKIYLITTQTKPTFNSLSGIGGVLRAT